MPGALLIEKCKANLRAGCHPVIITIFERVHTALNLAEDAGLAGRVEVWDVQQFLSSNIYEHSFFDERSAIQLFQRLLCDITRLFLKWRVIRV